MAERAHRVPAASEKERLMSTLTKPHTPAARKRLAVRAGAALATVGLAAGLAGFAVQAAQAAQAGQAATAAPVGTSNLIQSEDFGGIIDVVGELNHQSTNLYGDDPVTICDRYDDLEALTGNKHLTSLSSVWTNSDGETNAKMKEAIAQAQTKSAAKAAAAKVLATLRDCQQMPPGNWHYGQVYHGPLRDGDHVWMDIISGKGKVTGGVAVMLEGNRFGVLEVTSTAGDGDDAIKDAVLPAEERLAG
jgi:hypothetical protein